MPRATGRVLTVSAPVAPVAIPVAGAIHSWPQSLFPLESVLQQISPLHITSSRESQKPASFLAFYLFLEMYSTLLHAARMQHYQKPHNRCRAQTQPVAFYDDRRPLQTASPLSASQLPCQLSMAQALRGAKSAAECYLHQPTARY